MLQTVLASNLGFMQMGRERNIADLDDAAARKAIMPEGTSINWLLGHILMARQGPHKLLGLDSPAPTAKLAPYDRGTSWDEKGEDHLTIAELSSLLAASDEALKAAIATVSDERLEGPMPEGLFPFPVASLGAGIAAFQFHESYHLGQLGTARRLLGLPGAIA